MLLESSIILKLKSSPHFHTLISPRSAVVGHDCASVINPRIDYFSLNSCMDPEPRGLFPQCFDPSPPRCAATQSADPRTIARPDWPLEPGDVPPSLLGNHTPLAMHSEGGMEAGHSPVESHRTSSREHPMGLAHEASPKDREES